MDWKTLVTPETVMLLLAIVIALLLKSKILTEKDIKTAKDALKEGFERFEGFGGSIEAVKSKITDKTGLTLPQVTAIAKDIQVQVSGGDSDRKKVQRAARAALRGWLRF